jgi:hypothetical protein
MPASQVDSLNAAIAKASARRDYVQAQLTRTSTLARQSFEPQQALDQAENDAASGHADVAEAQANYDAAVAGPTKEERAIADAQVQAAAAAVSVLERRLAKAFPSPFAGGQPLRPHKTSEEPRLCHSSRGTQRKRRAKCHEVAGHW